MSDISDSCALVEVSALPSVFGSERAIVQLLRHLIENAIKFRLPMAIPEVRVYHTEDEGPIVFSVADNGIGVEETAHNIFDIFRRLHGHGHYIGHGVGLAICKRIVHHHGGRIWYEANPSGGTIFNFTLPKSSRDSLGG